LQEVAVQDVRVARVRDDGGDHGRTRARDLRRAGGEEVRRQDARALEPQHAHVVAARGLAANLREQVHLRAADVERRDDVADPQAISRYTETRPSTMRSAVYPASMCCRPRSPIAARADGAQASIARSASASASAVIARARNPVRPSCTTSRAPSTGVAT